MNTLNNKRNDAKLKLVRIAVFAMLGTIMFVSKILMEVLPNIHLLGMLTMVYTIVFRVKALIPIYIYVLLNGIYAGFSIWWIPYLYIWTILWAVTMLLPEKMPGMVKNKNVVYPAICGIHGFAFGILYAPAHALMFKMNLTQMLVWISAGVPFDIIHGVGNIFAGLLVLPLSKVLRRLCKDIM